MMLRRTQRTCDPPPASVLSPAELARAEQWKQIYNLATYWHLEPSEVKRRLFVKCLIEAGRMGRGDRN